MIKAIPELLVRRVTLDLPEHKDLKGMPEPKGILELPVRKDLKAI